MIESALVGLAIMGIQLGFIDSIIKRRNRQKEQQLWTPFRILFFQSICDHHTQLMCIYSELVNEIKSTLLNVHNKGFVETFDIEGMQKHVKEYQTQLSDSDKSFHNIIQTVSASLKPEAAEHCNESLYFSYILNKYINELKVSCTSVLKVDDLTDKSKTSEPLNGIDAKRISLEMIVETRLTKFIENFSSSIWKTEGLYYYKGEIMEETDYKRAIYVDKSVAELSKTPRTLPIKNFFETEEEFENRAKDTGLR